MIPSTAHFIWLGASIPWVSSLAIRSALSRGGFERAVLHHEEALERSDAWRELREIDRLELRRLDERALLEPLSQGGVNLYEVYRELEQPAGRANVLRAAILLREGGVYLDADTITVRDLSELRRTAGAFVGEEHIALPYVVRHGRNPARLAAAFVRRAVRDLFRRLPGGWRSFRAIEKFYPAAVNNAVLGGRAGHPTLQRLVRAMLELDPAVRRRRFALGTHLLQQVVAADSSEDLRVLDSRYFYPLGPEISEHWFRARRRLPQLERVLFPETLVVHWYASVRTADIVPLIDRGYVEQNARAQFFSALALEVLEVQTKDEA